MKKLIASLALASLISTGASAQTIFDAVLTGLNENPPNGSPATGFASLTLNAAQNQITVDLNWSGLTSPATAAHIHGIAGAGTNAGVLFGFTGVPAATSGAIPQQSFAINPTQVSALFNGYLYVNVHTSTFPGGEIRGQLLLVPEPSTVAIAGIGAVATVLRLRRKELARQPSQCG